MPGQCGDGSAQRGGVETANGGALRSRISGYPRARPWGVASDNLILAYPSLSSIPLGKNSAHVEPLNNGICALHRLTAALRFQLS